MKKSKTISTWTRCWCWPSWSASHSQLFVSCSLHLSRAAAPRTWRICWLFRECVEKPPWVSGSLHVLLAFTGPRFRHRLVTKEFLEKYVLIKLHLKISELSLGFWSNPIYYLTWILLCFSFSSDLLLKPWQSLQRLHSFYNSLLDLNLNCHFVNEHSLVNFMRKLFVSKIRLQLPLSLSASFCLSNHLLQEKLHLLLVVADPWFLYSNILRIYHWFL